jgi:type I restriction enzyme R subunit
MANPLDKFELGIRKLIESLMIERMSDNDKIVTRYMADQDFQSSAFPILARDIFETVRGRPAGLDTTTRARPGNADEERGTQR